MIYFVERLDGCIKIGTTIRLSQRLAQLRAEHGAGLKVLAVTDGSFDEENQLHSRFSGCRFSGEWFPPAPGLLSFIEQHADAWDGVDEVAAPLSVKLHMDVVESARIVSAYRNEQIADMLSDILRPVLAKMERDEVARRTGGQPPKR